VRSPFLSPRETADLHDSGTEKWAEIVKSGGHQGQLTPA
jgi:hypothetical protein